MVIDNKRFWPKALGGGQVKDHRARTRTLYLRNNLQSPSRVFRPLRCGFELIRSDEDWTAPVRSKDGDGKGYSLGFMGAMRRAMDEKEAIDHDGV